MDFDSANKHYHRLSRLLREGRISQDEFVRGVDNLSVEDDIGNEWQIGIQSGRWYRKEGDYWVEDDPLSPPPRQALPTSTATRKHPVRWLLVLLLLVLSIIYLLGPKYLSQGVLPEENSVDLSRADGTDQPLQAEAPEADAPANRTNQTPSPTLETGSATLSASLENTPTPQPSLTLTLPPPPGIPPQIWQERSKLSFEPERILMGGWLNFQEMPWEYEYITFKGREVLLLQYEQALALLSDDQPIESESEHEITLALARGEAVISLVCRWDSEQETGYALQLTREDWLVARYTQGIKTVLAQGSQSEAFMSGEFGTFRMICTGERITVWDGSQMVAEVVQEISNAGEQGLLFDVEKGVGLVFIAEDLMLLRAGDETKSGKNSIVRLGPIDVQLVRSPSDYAELHATAQSGRPLIGVVLRIVNNSGKEVEINSENIYLQNDEQVIHVLPNPPQENSGHSALDLPLSIERSESTGAVFFEGLSLSQLAGWELVVDLRYEGYGAARFGLID